MHFSLPHPIRPEYRSYWTRNLGRIVSRTDMEPYMPNEGDDTYWTIDSGNDWKVTFYNDALNEFSLTYRYNGPNSDMEAAIAPWLKARFDAVAISESSQHGPFAPKVVLP